MKKLNVFNGTIFQKQWTLFEEQNKEEELN